MIDHATTRRVRTENQGLSGSQLTKPSYLPLNPMECANFHHPIAEAGLPEAADVVDDTAALDTAVDVLNPDPATRDAPIGRFLRAREGSAPGLLGGHDDLDLVQGKRQ